jgi:hypothetical protein
MRNAYRILVSNLKGRQDREDRIKIDIKERVPYVIEWTALIWQ